MGPKGKKESTQHKSGTIPPILHKDLLHRISFAHQASVYLKSLGAGHASGRDSEGWRTNGASPHETGGSRGSCISGMILVSDRLAENVIKGSKRVAGHNQLKM